MPARPYQIKAIESIRNFFISGGLHCILQAPTGAGKTYIFSLISKKANDKGKRVLILTDRSELLYQTGGALKNVGLNTFYIQAGSKVVNNHFNVFVGMSQTLRKRIDLTYWIYFFKSIDLLIIDECHDQQFNWILESGLFDNKHVIGVTATPKRTGKMRQLALDYTKIIKTISVRELIEQGYLTNDDYYGIPAPDLSNVEFDHKTGDYKTGSLFKKFNSPTAYAGSVKNYKELTPGTKSIVFCVNIEHCIRTAIAFNHAGLKAKFIVSNLSKPKMPNIEDLGAYARYVERKRVYDLLQENKHLTGNRTQLFNDFKENKFKILINAGIATKGYDEPSLETGIILRATLSTSLWLQMIGRLSRIFEGKTHFNILDFGSNAERLGHYTEERIWSLWHETFEGEGLPPIKECGIKPDGRPILVNGNSGCKRPILASYKICPFCGFKYPEKEAVEIDLEGIMFDAQSKMAVKTKRLKDMTNQELHDHWKLKGHKTAWLWRQLWYRGKEKSIYEFGKKFHWNISTIESAIKWMK